MNYTKPSVKLTLYEDLTDNTALLFNFVSTVYSWFPRRFVCPMINVFRERHSQINSVVAVAYLTPATLRVSDVSWRRPAQHKRNVGRIIRTNSLQIYMTRFNLKELSN